MPTTASSCSSVRRECTSVRENHAARNGNDIAIFEASGNTVSRNRLTDALVCSFCFGPTGFGIGITGGSTDNVVSNNVVSRTQVDGIGITDFDPSDPGNPLPDRTTVRGNIVRHAGEDGVHVDAGIAGTVLERNRAFGAGDDGIQVDSTASVLTGNRASLDRGPRHRGRPRRHRRRRQPGPPQRQPGAVPRGRLRLDRSQAMRRRRLAPPAPCAGAMARPGLESGTPPVPRPKCRTRDHARGVTGATRLRRGRS